MLEIIATHLEDAIRIEKAGANRIELVTAMSEGGLTPSYGMIENLVKSVKIPVNVMIRPYSHSFEYDSSSLEIMKKDIEMAQKLGVNGLVLGILREQVVAFELLEDLLKDVSCQVTFHRAIDQSIRLKEDYSRLVKHPKITQILTSAGPGKAEDHLTLLKEMYDLRPEKLLIGSGVNQNNISRFKKDFPLSQIHVGSAGRIDNDFKKGIDIKKIQALLKEF